VLLRAGRSGSGVATPGSGYPGAQDRICVRVEALPLNIVMKPKVFPLPLERTVMIEAGTVPLGLPDQIADTRCGEAKATMMEACRTLLVFGHSADLSCSWVGSVASSERMIDYGFDRRGRLDGSVASSDRMIDCGLDRRDRLDR
jgi:hypothetical protein